MISRTIRPLTEAEQEKLGAISPLLKFQFGSFLGYVALTAILFAGGGYFVGKALDHFVKRSDEKEIFAPIFLILGVICTVISVVRSEKQRREDLQRAHAKRNAAASDCRMEEIECTVSMVAELQEAEDEGPGFFLQVDDDLLLFLRSQQFHVDEFPVEKIRLARDTRTHSVFNLSYSGSPLKPSRVIETTHRFGGPSWLEEGMFLKGTVEELPDMIAEWRRQKDALDDVLGA